MAEQIPCQTCGQMFTPRTSGGKPQIRCSEKCRRKVSNDNFTKKHAPVPAATCAECGERITHADLGRPRRFCSDQCRQRAGNRALRRRRLPIRDPDPEPRNCAFCGSQFVPRRKDQIYCPAGPGSYCVQKAYWARKAAGDPLRQVEQTKTCQECGKDFTAYKANARWCSVSCRRRFTAREESRRRGPIRPDHVQYVDREIFERDGWRCHICREPVDPHLPRRHRDGATIDHLVPLSLGGADEPNNVATAHNRCNREKRNAVKAEDLAGWAVEHYPDLVAAALAARKE